MANWRDKNQNKSQSLFASGVKVSRTASGGDADAELRTVNLFIPANTLEVGDTIHAGVLYECDNNANAKRFTVRFGTSNTVAPNNNSVLDFNAANQAGLMREIEIYIASSTTYNVFSSGSQTGTGVGITKNVSALFDITADNYLDFSTKLDLAATDTMSIVGHTVTLIKGD